MEPGETFSVPFRLESNGSGGHFTFQATNDRGFASAFPDLLPRDGAGCADGTVTLRVPPATPAGTAATLTLLARAPGGNDTNYLVLRFSIAEVTNH